ncbi:protein kinase [Leptodontidium sp. MPI-SDFR-AT-0119]|nr:protein kinase [Leptodontidium sp. MPI-SDFR-AT-0119]
MALPAALDYGYFVDSDSECDIESEAEPRERYGEGLYYPTQIGEILSCRYRIEHKLDQEVALKIMITDEGQTECQIQGEMHKALQDPSQFVLYQDVFYIASAGGTQHMVFVYPLRGLNLRDTFSETPVALRMSAAKQLLLAVKSMHDAGFVHKDLNLGNVMWDIKSIDGWPTAEIYRIFGRPRKTLLHEAKGKPGELVEPLRIPTTMIGTPVYLGDFGLSFRHGDAVEATIQFPLPFCAPERLHSAVPSFTTDMWSYMVIFLTLYLGFNPITGNGTMCVSRVIGILGPFPEHWKSSYTGGDAIVDWWWDHSGKVAPPELPLETLRAKIARRRPDVSERERDHVLDLLRRGLCYEPESRITAAQLLVDPSFTALMAIYGL